MRRILIIKLSSIGDCLLASPVAQALRQSFPDAFIGWAVEDFCAPMVEGNPFLDAVFVWRRRGKGESLWAFARRLRREGFEVALDLQGLLKSALVAWFSGAKVRVGPAEAREGAPLLYTHRVPPAPWETHVIERYLLRAAALGARWERVPPLLVPYGPQEQAWAAQWLQDKGVREGEILVAINPAVGRGIRRWEAARFAALADRLRKELGVRILLTGGPQDRALNREVLARMATAPEALDAAGETTLRQLAALYERCSLFIGGDTGPMHIAEAAGTPVLALHGPTDPRHTGPYGPPHRALYKAFPCSPCRYKEDCPFHKECLRAISVEEVFETAQEMLGELLPSAP